MLNVENEILDAINQPNEKPETPPPPPVTIYDFATLLAANEPTKK